MVTILNGTQSSPVPPGSLVRVAIKQAPAEVLLSPTLLLNLQSWRTRFSQWATLLAESGSGVVPVSVPTIAGDPRLSTQVLVLDVRLKTDQVQMTAGRLADQISGSMPLGADLRILDLTPAGEGSQGMAVAREKMANDLARVLPALPGLLGGSTGTNVLVVVGIVAVIVFLLGTGARNLRQSVS